MVEWYWVLIASWVGAAVGVIVASLCVISSEHN
jgi:hypothetical protein